jgi:hypothetical protein
MFTITVRHVIWDQEKYNGRQKILFDCLFNPLVPETVLFLWVSFLVSCTGPEKTGAFPFYACQYKLIYILIIFSCK